MLTSGGTPDSVRVAWLSSVCSRGPMSSSGKRGKNFRTSLKAHHLPPNFSRKFFSSSKGETEKSK